MAGALEGSRGRAAITRHARAQPLQRGAARARAGEERQARALPAEGMERGAQRDLRRRNPLISVSGGGENRPCEFARARWGVVSGVALVGRGLAS